jgi:hypothetical protein
MQAPAAELADFGLCGMQRSDSGGNVGEGLVQLGHLRR